MRRIGLAVSLALSLLAPLLATPSRPRKFIASAGSSAIVPTGAGRRGCAMSCLRVEPNGAVAQAIGTLRTSVEPHFVQIAKSR